MAKFTELEKTRQDPMGVKRRWGKRELLFLIVAIMIVGAAALISHKDNRGRSLAGSPVGALPLGSVPRAPKSPTQ